LQHWLADRETQGDSVLLLNASALSLLSADDITAALDLGRLAALQRGSHFVVGVDALDSIGSVEQRARTVVALRALAALGATVCVACRGLQWRTMRDTSEPDPDWKAAELDEWPEARVRQLVNTSVRSTLAGDIIRLLRTPLMLDIFLRTFGMTEAVPGGLQTRHGLLQIYWSRRILPADNERSAERRHQLDAASVAEARGVHRHLIEGPAARDLTSEGLFIIPSDGLTGFRHVLLRDFAMMQWLLTSASDCQKLAARMATISPSLVRYGALRALLEALWSANGWSSIRCTSLLSELRPPLLYDAATVLGEFDCLQDIDLTEIAQSLPKEERGPFFGRLFSEAKLTINAEWLHVLTRLPLERPGTASIHWMTPEIVAQIVLTCEALSTSAPHRFTDYQPMCFALAARLRNWSIALYSDDSTNGGYQHEIGVLVRLLVRLDPSIATLQWVSTIAGRGGHLAYWVLSELSKLVRAILDRNQSPSDDKLREVYLSAAGLVYDSGWLRESMREHNGILHSAHRKMAVLLGEHGHEGLIAIRPTAYVPIAVDLLAHREASEQASWEKKRASWNIDDFCDLRPEIPAQIKQIEDLALTAVEAPLEANLGLAEVELYSRSYWGVNQDCDVILDRLKAMALTSLKESTSLFDDVFWPAVARSKSLAARACTLDLLTLDEPSLRPRILDELLKDTRLYFPLSTQHFLQRAISMRWRDLSPADRTQIITNIRTCGRSPIGSIYRPGPLAGAIPEDERPPSLEIFMELYRVHGWSLHVPDPRETAPLDNVEPGAVAKTPWREITGLTSESQTLWQRFESLKSPHSARNTEEDWTLVVSAVTDIVTAGLPDGILLLDRSELVDRLANFCEVQIRDRQNRTNSSWASVDTLKGLALWSIEAMRQMVLATDAKRCEPLDDPSAILPRSIETWLCFAAVADWALWDPVLREERDLDRALYAAIAEQTKVLPPRFAMRLLGRIQGWFRAAPYGEKLLWDLLYDRIRSARVLEHAVHLLCRFSLSEQTSLMVHWLTDDLSPAIEHHDQLLRACGARIGCIALVQLDKDDERRNPYREVLWELIAEPPAVGLLSDPDRYALFVGQTVFGAKEALTSGNVSVDRACEFVEQVTRSWNRLLPLLSEENGNHGPAFSLWVFSPVLDTESSKYHNFSPSMGERLSWLRALTPLAKKIVHTGPWREVDDLTRLLADSSLASSVALTDAQELLEILNQRCNSEIVDGLVLYHRNQAIAGAAQFAGVVGMNVSAAAQNELHAILTGWSLPPISNEEAARAARQLRMQTGAHSECV